MPKSQTMLYHAIKTYMVIGPVSESMGGLRAWVHDVPWFSADVTDITLRSMIETAVAKWEHVGAKVMWGLYLSIIEQSKEE